MLWCRMQSDLDNIPLTRREVLGAYLSNGWPVYALTQDLGEREVYLSHEVFAAMDWREAATRIQVGSA